MMNLHQASSSQIRKFYPKLLFKVIFYGFYHGKPSLKHHLGNEKNHGCLGFCWGWHFLPSHIRDYFINHEIRIPMNQPGWLVESRRPSIEKADPRKSCWSWLLRWFCWNQTLRSIGFFFRRLRNFRRSQIVLSLFICFCKICVQFLQFWWERPFCELLFGGTVALQQLVIYKLRHVLTTDWMFIPMIYTSWWSFIGAP